MMLLVNNNRMQLELRNIKNNYGFFLLIWHCNDFEALELPGGLEDDSEGETSIEIFLNSSRTDSLAV
jgi:hypothetical protein